MSRKHEHVEGPSVTVPAGACREDLDLARCVHGCDNHPIALHSVCHPDDPTWAFYSRDTGRLDIRCSVCDQGIASIQVARRELVM